MSSAQVDRPTKVGNVNKKENEKSRKLFNPSHKKHKHEDNRHFKFGRKRLQSFTANGKFFPPYKRRKKEGAIIPPTKFLLGGNICDPLNLNSMQDEEINRAMNAVTPKSSPLPTPKHRKGAIEVIIPPNICDPLNLSNCNDNEEYEKQLISPTKKCSKRRNRKRKRASSGSGKDDTNDSIEVKVVKGEAGAAPEKAEEGSSETVQIESEHAPLNSPPRNPPKEPKQESPQKDKNKLRLKGLEEAKDKRLRKVDVKDKIVSPVIPQPGAWKPRPQHRPSQDKKKKPQQMPNFRAKDAQYQYGNYNRYYGYRNPHHDVDTRLTIFAQRKEMFFGKDVLDIGCNIGHITLSVARDFSARSVTGIDIDRKLINIARKNIKHYVNCVQSPASNDDGGGRKDCDTSFFPMSMPINYGPVDIPGFTKNDHKGFPYNVTFVQGNYILEDDSLLSSEQPQFDTILCLSITKWLHLNFGDAGLKQAFKRMHAQLRPSGVLVLEPQNWASYGKKKNLTEKIYKNYQTIEFLPHKFTQYLLSSEVGFSKCEVVSIPPHPSKGFQRPIQLFTKAAATASNAPEPYASTRNERKDYKQREFERREYERELFPHELKKGNFSDLSQRSSESMTHYDHLENVYAPSATPCYDTPGYNNDSQPLDSEKKMCYVDMDIEQGDASEKSEQDHKKRPERPKEDAKKKPAGYKQETCAKTEEQSVAVKEKGDIAGMKATETARDVPVDSRTRLNRKADGQTGQGGINVSKTNIPNIGDSLPRARVVEEGKKATDVGEVVRMGVVGADETNSGAKADETNERLISGREREKATAGKDERMDTADDVSDRVDDISRKVVDIAADNLSKNGQTVERTSLGERAQPEANKGSSAKDNT